MSKIFKKILFALIFVVTASNIFAQTSDDWDNDGVKNSEDVCPNNKGTTANKGCPEKTAKPVPKSNPNTKTTANKCVSGDCVNGKGKLVYASGNVYEGDFVNGKAEGLGTSTFTNRATYTGQYSKGLFHGKGKYVFPDGGVYDGNWVNGKMEGKGRITFSDGNSYEGDFVSHKKEGQGIFKFKDGRIYTGQFSKDTFHGKGTMTYSDSSIYDGNWVNGIREGQGIYTAKDGSYYSGEWKNGKSNGYGKDYNKATNTMREGTYKDGFFVPATAPIPNINDSEENRVNGLKEYYKQAFQKLGISFVKEGTAVTTSTRYGLTVESTLEAGYVYHFIGICPNRILVSGEGEEYEKYYAAGFLAKSSVPQKYGLTSYFYTASYYGEKSSSSYSFKPTRQKVYWMLFRSKRNSTKLNDEVSQATSEPLDEDFKGIQEERTNSAVAGLSPEQRRKATESFAKMNADEKIVNETANALVPVMKRRKELEQSFLALNDKLQSDTKNRVTHAVQMKKDAEEMVMIYEQFLSKYGTELGNTDSPNLNAKVVVINQQIREMRYAITVNKKNIERLEKVIKGNN